MAIILASASPRRRELLARIIPEFQVIPYEGDEQWDPALPLEEVPLFLAVQKACGILDGHGEDIIIGCDTVVALDGQIFGKPEDEKHAAAMLGALSGRVHEVITGVCILCKGEQHAFSATTQVEFYALTDREIHGYIRTGEPYDKAGAYGIQGQGGLFVKSIAGDYNNVVGLPLPAMYRKLCSLHIM